MTGEDVTTDQRLLLSTVYNLWSSANGAWPLYAQVDKQLDAQGIDAEGVLENMVRGLVRADGPLGSQRVLLTVRALAELPGPPQITETFVAAVRYLVSREQSHNPVAPDDLVVVVTSADFGKHLETSASIPRPPEVAAQMAKSVGDLLNIEGHLWNQFMTGGDGGWRLHVARGVRRFRGTESLEDYLARVDEMLTDQYGASAPRRGQPQVAGSTDVAKEAEEMVPPEVDPRRVFVIHGRDLAAKKAVYALLKDLDLRPWDWEELVAKTGSAAPYVGDTVSRAFQVSQAVVVVLTPDDVVRLHPALHGQHDPPDEVELTGQARPNVLFEAGMALATHPERTVFVQIGKVRQFSDVAGRHMLSLTGAADTLHAVATRLQTAGCSVDMSGPAWLDESRFKDLEAQSRRAGPEPKNSTAGRRILG
jgi:predicted nucleotide-binding protein